MANSLDNEDCILLNNLPAQLSILTPRISDHLLCSKDCRCSPQGDSKGNFNKHPWKHLRVPGAIPGNEEEEGHMAPVQPLVPSSLPGGHHLSWDIINIIPYRGYFSGGRIRTDNH